ncbi:hypothetical protein FF1_029626 [Malus domestica]
MQIAYYLVALSPREGWSHDLKDRASSSVSCRGRSLEGAEEDWKPTLEHHRQQTYPEDTRIDPCLSFLPPMPPISKNCYELG